MMPIDCRFRVTGEAVDRTVEFAQRGAIGPQRCREVPQQLAEIRSGDPEPDLGGT